MNFVRYDDEKDLLIEKSADELEVGDVINLTGCVVCTRPIRLYGQSVFIGWGRDYLIRQFPGSTCNVHIEKVDVPFDIKSRAEAMLWKEVSAAGDLAKCLVSLFS